MKEYNKFIVFIILLLVVVLVFFILNKKTINYTQNVLNYFPENTIVLFNSNNNSYNGILNDKSYIMVNKKADIDTFSKTSIYKFKKIYAKDKVSCILDNEYFICSDNKKNIFNLIDQKETRLSHDKFILKNLNRISIKHDLTFILNDFKYLENYLKKQLSITRFNKISLSSLIKNVIGYIDFNKKTINSSYLIDSKILSHKNEIQYIINNRKVNKLNYEFIPNNIFAYIEINSADVVIEILLRQYGFDIKQLNIISKNILNINIENDILSMFKGGVGLILVDTGYYRPQLVVVLKDRANSLNKLISVIEQYFSDHIQKQEIELTSQTFSQYSSHLLNNNICIGKAYGDYSIIGEQPAVEQAMKSIKNKEKTNFNKYYKEKNSDISFFINGENIKDEYLKKINNIIKYDNDFANIFSDYIFTEDYIKGDINIEFKKKGIDEYFRKIIKSQRITP